jgi:FKBP-type peptidyl-prolyl cis-trans isomerase FklB
MASEAERDDMRLYLIVLMSAGAALAAMAAEQTSPLTNPRDKMSYTLGMSMGQTVTNWGIEINPDLVAAGLKAMVRGEKPLLTEAEFQESMKAFNTERQAKMQAKRAEMMAKQAEKAKESGDKNKQDGQAFLVQNRMKEGVKTTPSGLQYKIVTPGTGKIPTLADTVVTQYRGTYVDGKEFDNSYKREPFITSVTNVIKGWTEALTMMPVGSKWQLVIPPDLAYGAAGKSPVPPNATLLFDMELIGIQDKSEKPK